MDEDTIAAIATPFGIGGIGIIKISGPQALKIISTLFRSRHLHGTPLSHHLYYGEIIDPENDSIIDEVLISYMAKPSSYTREDVVEINCHSGPLVLKKILELVIKSGARPAEPGEFTKRAYLNGRIDLAQAEAVIDLIEAKTLSALRTASNQLKGLLSQKIKEIKDELLLILSHLEAQIDFPEEDIETLTLDKIQKKLEEVLSKLESLLKTYETGRLYQEGISVIITGKPNVGKSSLLNALIGEKKAIVTPIPGTTRDAIEEMISLKGIPVKIIDTAGLREPKDLLEEEGVRVTWDKVSQADLVILVIDSHQGLDDEDRKIRDALQEKPFVIAYNKIDLPSRITQAQVKEEFPGKSLIPVSALQRKGLEELREAIVSEVTKNRIEYPAEILITSFRHKQSLEKARACLQSLLHHLSPNLPPEYFALDLQTGIEALREILGESYQEEILDQIFSRFCIGK